MNDHIKKMIETGQLVLMLGAGASSTSKDRNGDNLLCGAELSKFLAENVGLLYNEETLQEVYTAVRGQIGDRVYGLLEEKLKHCVPSEEYITLSKYPWPRIYTLNIDDSLDKALIKYSCQNINIRNRFDKLSDRDQLYQELDYVKLNGGIDRLQDGIVFSVKDYAKGSNQVLPWYEQVAQDFFRFTFLFIGTKLKEPLFYHHIERHKIGEDARSGFSYALTPHATAIESEALKSEYKIVHLDGTITDFTKWLTKVFPAPISCRSLAERATPAIKAFYSNQSESEKIKIARTLKNVLQINHENLLLASSKESTSGKIRDFYRGFKPTWQDIIDDVPAKIHSTREFYDFLNKCYVENIKAAVVYGPAGSGKSTLLKQISLMISDNSDVKCYFVNGHVNNIKEIIHTLESLNDKKFFLFYDRIDVITEEISELCEYNLLNKCIFVGAESQNVWMRRVKSHLEKYCKAFEVSQINDDDARAILKKLKQFGPWTRLRKYTEQRQVLELVEKSKRQLLIGLLETTLGRGFEEIIENEYNKLTSHNERVFLTLVGLATIHRISILEDFVMRALRRFGIDNNVDHFLKIMSGIVTSSNNRLVARHPVYVRHLFERVISKNDIYEAIVALLHSYTVYSAPVIKRVSKNEAVLFKQIINHNFLKAILRRDEKLINNIYSSFEKHFEADGLFWLQYGLALRDFDDHYAALEKLQIAYEAYPQPHTIHALATQELIIATRIDSKTKAYQLLDNARERLLSIDDKIKSDDTYPIVTLSEEHTKIILKFDGPSAAKQIAKDYANIISGRMKHRSDERLRLAWQKLSTFALSGKFEDSDVSIIDDWT